MAVNDTIKTSYNFNTEIRPWLNDYSEGSEVNIKSLVVLTNPEKGNVYIDGSNKVVYQPNHNFTGTDKFSYRIADLKGNFSEPATVFIDVTGTYIPNTITPNNDSKNDTFSIIGLNLFDYVELKVFDRFGKLKYESQNYNNNWTPDESVKEGTYYYNIIFYKQGFKSYSKNGYILILKDLDLRYI
ncbi:gliding motility-associated C-terminal domain-containing protein [Sphingobacterium sp. xlx-96]|uniref:T9SS type B sorting domain-containing protein n=1 Tax=Sphingobacterium TaxID=28453 RepID=UPI00397CFE59